MSRMSELHAEQDDSGRAEYEEYCYLKAEAERLQALYLSFVQQLPTVYDRTREKQDEADAINWSMIVANRKVRAAETDLKWTRREHAKV